MDRDQVSPSDDADALRRAVVDVLRTVRDPEIPVDIYELGLIYAVEFSEAGLVRVRMTLTTPNCPVAESLPGQVRRAVEAVPGVERADVELVWEPKWTPERMSDVARLTMETMGVALPTPFTSLTRGRKPANGGPGG